MRCVVVGTSAGKSVCFLDRQSRILRTGCDHDTARIELKASKTTLYGCLFESICTTECLKALSELFGEADIAIVMPHQV